MKVLVNITAPHVGVSITPPALKVASGGKVLRSKPYEGEYSVTPTEEEIVLPTAGLAMRGNVTVAPIPQTYGRITRVGSNLIVS